VSGLAQNRGRAPDPRQARANAAGAGSPCSAAAAGAFPALTRHGAGSRTGPVPRTGAGPLPSGGGRPGPARSGNDWFCLVPGGKPRPWLCRTNRRDGLTGIRPPTSQRPAGNGLLADPDFFGVRAHGTLAPSPTSPHLFRKSRANSTVEGFGLCGAFWYPLGYRISTKAQDPFHANFEVHRGERYDRSRWGPAGARTTRPARMGPRRGGEMRQAGAEAGAA